jgi:hypothetical protein
MKEKSPAPRVDLALLAHEISGKLQGVLEEYGGTLVLCRERGRSTLQVQLDGENDLAITLVTAAANGVYRFVAIGKEVMVSDELPDWLDLAAWNRWLAYRSEIRKPLTKRTRKAQLTLLGEIHRDGMSQSAAIEQSIRNGWVGLFPGKTSQAITRGAAQVDDFVGGAHEAR